MAYSLPLSGAVVFAPGGGGAGIRRELLLRQLHDLSRGEVQLIDVGAAGRDFELVPPADIVQHAVVDPFSVEADHRILHGPLVAAADQNFLRPVGMQQHQVRARRHEHRPGDFGIEFLMNVIARAGRGCKRCRSRI